MRISLHLFVGRCPIPSVKGFFQVFQGGKKLVLYLLRTALSLLHTPMSPCFSKPRTLEGFYLYRATLIWHKSRSPILWQALFSGQSIAIPFKELRQAMQNRSNNNAIISYVPFCFFFVCFVSAFGDFGLWPSFPQKSHLQKGQQAQDASASPHQVHCCRQRHLLRHCALPLVYALPSFSSVCFLLVFVDTAQVQVHYRCEHVNRFWVESVNNQADTNEPGTRLWFWICGWTE